jgi:hypothetical protein
MPPSDLADQEAQASHCSRLNPDAAETGPRGSRGHRAHDPIRSDSFNARTDSCDRALSVSATYTRRWWGNFMVTDNLLFGAALLTPTVIPIGRMVKIGAQFDF